jgi:hypothetical protein
MSRRAGLGFRERDEFLHVARRHAWMHGEQPRHQRHHRDRREVLERVVGQRLVHMRIDRMGADQQAQCVAIGRGPRQRVGADDVVAAGLVVDDDGLPECFGQLLADRARQHIGRTARRQRHDDADGLRRVGLLLCLCMRAAGCEQQCRACRGQKNSSLVSHGVVLRKNRKGVDRSPRLRTASNMPRPIRYESYRKKLSAWVRATAAAPRSRRARSAAACR